MTSGLENLHVENAACADAENCLWCLEGAIALALGPDSLDWRRDQHDNSRLKYRDPNPLHGDAGGEGTMDFLPTAWWTEHFGVGPVHLTPPETYPGAVLAGHHRVAPQAAHARTGSRRPALGDQ